MANNFVSFLAFVIPLYTESCLSAPGRAITKGFEIFSEVNTSSYSSLHTTTISPISLMVANFLSEYTAIGTSSKGKYCFGMFAPIRFPTPPARRTKVTELSSTLFASVEEAFGLKAFIEPARYPKPIGGFLPLDGETLDGKEELCLHIAILILIVVIAK